jgi:peptidoglycan/LPS O-acetylase OafA/YrhL
MFHFWLTSPAVSRHWQAFLPPIILQYVPHFILTFLLAFALAEISWCCLESPMLSLRKHFRSKAKPIEVQSRVAELSAAAR